MANKSMHNLVIRDNNYEIVDASVRLSMADEYNLLSTYSVGDFVIYNGRLYQCNTAIPIAENWTPAHWTVITVADQIASLKSDVSTKYTKPSGGIPASDLASSIVTATVSVTGSTPTITADENTRYICGEVTSLSFTPCNSGICDVRFTSGSTVTVLTVPSTVKFPDWFNAASLNANTIYEINILDGVYGVVATWAV